MYVKWIPVDGSGDMCCKCTDTIGAVKRDWMANGGGTYRGRVTSDVNGMNFDNEGVYAADAFLKGGASDNWYYVTSENQHLQKPVRFTEHWNGKLK